MLQVQMVEVCCSEENGKKRTKEYPSGLYSRNLEAARQSGKAGGNGLFSTDDVEKEFLLQSLQVSECKG